MFLPYKIKDSEIQSLVSGELLSKSFCSEFHSLRENIRSSISAIDLESTVVNGTQLQEEWFPVDFADMKFDVFISHSHADVNRSVLPLASWLYHHLGLRLSVLNSY